MLAISSVLISCINRPVGQYYGARLVRQQRRLGGRVSNPVQLSMEGDLAIITIDNPPVNATSAPVRSGLLNAVRRAEASQAFKGIIHCAGRTFVAGGNLSEFDRPAEEPHLPDVYQAIEDSPVIWIAACHGTVLGGGFELAMACAYRIAVAGTRFGLPEINLGLIPGAGGTQRLPRLVGVKLAADLVTSGRMITAETLKEAGGLDTIIGQDLLAAARDFSSTVSEKPQPVSQRSIASDADFFGTMRKSLTKRARGAEAPLLNLDAVEWSTRLPFSEGQPKERALHLERRQSAQSKALRYAFFAKRAVAKPAAVTGATAGTIERVAVIGGGLMGGGIAAACLMGGLTVDLCEQEDVAAQAAHERVLGLMSAAHKRGKLSAEAYQNGMARFSVFANLEPVSQSDLVIEAVFEDLAVKRALFAQVADLVGPGAILATNTSYLDPRDIFELVPNQSRCLGLHFFSPAQIMKLLEIVRLSETSSDTLATAFKLASALRKTPVLSGICDGFIGNRMLAAYRRQADYLLADGASPQQIDAAMRAFGLPMGPYELQDLTGLQIAWANRKNLAATRPAAERYVPIADRLCELERFGQRVGTGWYDYAEGDTTPQFSPMVDAAIDAYRAEARLTPQSFSETDIQMRLMAVLANEGARIVEEGIAEAEPHVDVVKLSGYGFPRWRGGPLYFADQNETAIRAALADVVAQSPDSWVRAERYRA